MEDLREKIEKHFLNRLTKLHLPYKIRLISLNLLLFPSTNPELSEKDIAALIGAISFFMIFINPCIPLLTFSILSSASITSPVSLFTLFFASYLLIKKGSTEPFILLFFFLLI